MQALKSRNVHSFEESTSQSQSQLQSTSSLSLSSSSSASPSKMNINFRKSFTSKFSLKKPSPSNQSSSSQLSSQSSFTNQSLSTDENEHIPIKLISLLDDYQSTYSNNEDNISASILENPPNQEIATLRGHKNEVNYLNYHFIILLLLL